MKTPSFSVFNSASICVIAVLIIAAACPFNLMDMEQAQRIAKWKSDFEQLSCCFKLADIYEGAMAEKTNYDDKTALQMLAVKLKPYFNYEDEHPAGIKGYKYRRKNGRAMPKHSQFYFNSFLKKKDGSLISFKKNVNLQDEEKEPLYYMFIDINGEKKPNRTGEDIFFINVYKHQIKALGADKDYARLKRNCSPAGSGLYCSEFYLLGGRF